MQANLERGKAASGARGAGRFVAILAGVPLVATLALSAPDRALAACGTTQSTGAHAAASSGGSVHAATARPATSGGGGSGGCASGSSASALHGLATAASGRVIEGSAHAVGRTGTHARTAATSNAATTRASHAATTRATNASAHAHAVRPAHRA